MATGDRARLVVVLATQRSGSNWVEGRLSSHPAVAFLPHEPFRRSLRSPGSFEDFRRCGVRKAFRGPFAPVGRVLFLARARADAETPIVGFRVMYDQLRRSPTLTPTVLLHRPVVLHLVRRNVLAAHVSAVRARATGRFTSAEAEAPAGVRVQLEVESLLGSLDRRRETISRHRRVLRRLPVRSLEVAYEDYVSAPEVYDRVVLGLLGADPDVPLTTNLQRMSSGPVADRIANLSAVHAALHGTRYEGMLDEA